MYLIISEEFYRFWSLVLTLITTLVALGWSFGVRARITIWCVRRKIDKLSPREAELLYFVWLQERRRKKEEGPFEQVGSPFWRVTMQHTGSVPNPSVIPTNVIKTEWASLCPSNSAVVWGDVVPFLIQTQDISSVKPEEAEWLALIGLYKELVNKKLIRADNRYIGNYACNGFYYLLTNECMNIMDSERPIKHDPDIERILYYGLLMMLSMAQKIIFSASELKINLYNYLITSFLKPTNFKPRAKIKFFSFSASRLKI